MNSFDKLIDVAVQALKDNVLESVILNNLGVRSLKYCTSQDADSTIVFDQYSDYSETIEYIKSLYTEIFVIESEEDINKVLSRKGIGFNKNSMSVATLTNGSEILITRLDSDNSDGVVIYMRKGLYKNYLDFEVLKGATVTQKKG